MQVSDKQLQQSSAEVIEEYIKVMKREINPSATYQRSTRYVLSRIDVMTATPDDIMKFLDSLRKPESVDPLHKWIGSYNFYVTILKRFFKWFNNSYCMTGIKKLKRREASIYSPSDLWTQEDDLLFLKYCPSKRDKCYHMISRDTSCRPSEILIGKGKYSSPEFVWIKRVAPTAIKFMNTTRLGEKYQNDLFVASYNLGEIYDFNLNENRTSLLPSNTSNSSVSKKLDTENVRFAQGLGRITDMDVGPDGKLYVLSQYNDRVTIFRISSRDKLNNQ